MTDKRVNPFDITKAVDFSDKEINDYWVDLSGDGGFMDMVKPNSPMPMIILGGKGSGKTHLMRYYSYATQKLRFDGDTVEGIKSDGYIGTYLRCGGLNAKRFNHQSDDVNWSLLFSYYMDLWLSQIFLTTIHDATENSDEFSLCEENICEEIYTIISQPDDSSTVPTNILELIKIFHAHQRVLDLAINNYSFSPQTMSDLNILTSPGKLLFFIPQIISRYFGSFSDVRFLYLIDELENLTEEQQKYVNTIVRENEAPCSFKIGARLYGLKTLATYSANEINKEGSEYEMLHLDEKLRNIPASTYKYFAKKLCFRRLSEAGFVVSSEKTAESDIKNIGKYFEADEKESFMEDATSFVGLKYADAVRPYFVRLEKQLMQIVNSNDKTISKKDVNKIVKYLSCSRYPLIEKANIFLLYQDWGKSKNLLESAKIISEECSRFILDSKYKCRQKNVLSHFRTDFFAQLLRECNLKQRYLGLSDFIDMSAGLPRNLLMILKHIYQWSVFNDESPFIGGNKISDSSQRDGVIEASDWFFRDARIVESGGSFIQDSISRLATFFKDIRFSDKPTECSLSTFSVDITAVSRITSDSLKAATDRSLLINIPGGQRDRNTKRVDSKYQLNPMLAPRWDLPVHRRGAIALNVEEVNAIFDDEYKETLDELIQVRVGRMTAPSFGKNQKKIKAPNSKQNDLFG